MRPQSVALYALILCADDRPRNPKLEQDLIDLGISYELVTGSTPATARIHYEELYDSKLPYSVMSDEQLAGTYGHLLMFKRAKSIGATHTILFEDDCVIELQGFRKLLENVNHLPDGILLLGACGGFVRRKKYTGGELEWRKGVGDTIAGSHCYLVKNDFIDMMIEHALHLQMLADSFHRDPKVPLLVSSKYSAWQMKDAKSFIPLMQSGQSKNPVRQLISSAKDDIMDRINFGVWGGRVLRLRFLESLVSILFAKLPGCKD